MSNLTGHQLGNYRLVRHLGTGGFGEVYLGTHIHLQRESAIKLLLRLDKQEIELFRNEAQIIARLNHPHIVTLFDYDVAGEMPFIVMMYAQQGTMRARHRPGTRIPLSEVIKYITQAASGLQFAHDQHVLHRDIKPANMLLGPGEQLLLSDFGIAVMWSGTRSISTQKVIGTHGYMAPEQFQGRPRPASDQYSLAITTYEWLSGSRPMADAPLGLGMLQLVRPETEIPAVRRVAPHLPPKLDNVLQRALSSDWQARFSSVREFAEELTRAANSGGPITYTTRPEMSAQATSPATPTLQPPVQPITQPTETHTPPEALSTILPGTLPVGTHMHTQSDAARPVLPETLAGSALEQFIQPDRATTATTACELSDVLRLRATTAASTIGEYKWLSGLHARKQPNPVPTSRYDTTSSGSTYSGQSITSTCPASHTREKRARHLGLEHWLYCFFTYPGSATRRSVYNLRSADRATRLDYYPGGN